MCSQAHFSVRLAPDLHTRAGVGHSHTWTTSIITDLCTEPSSGNFQFYNLLYIYLFFIHLKTRGSQFDFPPMILSDSNWRESLIRKC